MENQEIPSWSIWGRLCFVGCILFWFQDNGDHELKSIPTQQWRLRKNLGPGGAEKNNSWGTAGPHVTLKIRVHFVWSTQNHSIKLQTADFTHSFHNFQLHFLTLRNTRDSGAICLEILQ